MAIHKAVAQGFIGWLYTYNTAKVVKLESKIIGVLNRLIQIILFVIIIAWIFIRDRGYQYVDNSGIASSTSKLKGVAYTNSSDPRVGRRLWDSSDLNVDGHGNGAFFMTSNLIVTEGQVLGECPEHKDGKADCQNDKDCLPYGKPFHIGHGVSTGVCNKTTNTCMVEAWCPVEDDSPAVDANGKSTLQNTDDFTVFIKNSVLFPYYELTVSSLVEGADAEYLQRCHYHPANDPYCPIFRIGDIVALSDHQQNKDKKAFERISVKGGVVSIGIKWDCNLDYSLDDCKPEYKFKRLDYTKTNNISQGYNFRHAYYFEEDGKRKRDLIKRYGILFVIETDATARAFHFTTCLLNIGSGVALLSIAGLIMDIFILYVHRQKPLYRLCKIQDGKRLIQAAKSQPSWKIHIPDIENNNTENTTNDLNV